VLTRDQHNTAIIVNAPECAGDRHGRGQRLTVRYCFAASCSSPAAGSVPISASALSAPSSSAADTATPSRPAMTVACSVSRPAYIHTAMHSSRDSNAGELMLYATGSGRFKHSDSVESACSF